MRFGTKASQNKHGKRKQAYHPGNFDHAARYLSIKGYEPVNPFENGVSQDAHWMEHMRRDIALLLECDCIYMLQGWELSKGAKLELDVASSCGIKVLFE